MIDEPARIALITGGGSGIGRAAALALHAAGFGVAIVGRSEATLLDTAALAKSGSSLVGIQTFVADVACDDQVEAAFNATRDMLGRIDVVFCNAGVSARPVPLDQLTPAEWQAIVDVNLTGVFNCCRHAMRIMKAQRPKGGRIINNGSVSAFAPRPFSAPYTATKHAVTGLTKAIALDGRADNIACSQIDIGNAATDMTETMADGILQADGSMRSEPRMDVAHVAAAILYIAQLPLDANVLNMTLKATAMPFEGRG